MFLKNKNKKGMTILELLVSSLVLSFAFLGFTYLKMKTIYSDRYSYNMNIISIYTKDFVDVYRNQLSNESDSTSRNEIIELYKDTDWTEVSELKEDCFSSDYIDETDLCSQEDMVETNTQILKINVLKEIPIASFSFIDCSEDSTNQCLIISWDKDIELTERDCKTNFNFCYVVEI